MIHIHPFLTIFGNAHGHLNLVTVHASLYYCNLIFMPEYALPTFLFNSCIFHLKSKQDCKNSNCQQFITNPNQFAIINLYSCLMMDTWELRCLAQKHNMNPASQIWSPAHTPIG